MRALALVATVLLGLAGCAAPQQSGWDSQGAESLKQEVTKILGKLDSGIYVGTLDDADSNVVIMDFDANNNPIRVDGIAAAREFFNTMGEMARSQGLKFTSTPVRSDAWATSTMGYCMTEYDQSITVGGQTMGPFKFRATLVARRDGDRWLMTHWHGSFREMPAMAATPDTTARH